MNEKEILMKIAEIILWAIHLVANVNLKSDIIRMEHFNGSIFERLRTYRRHPAPPLKKPPPLYSPFLRAIVGGVFLKRVRRNDSTVR